LEYEASCHRLCDDISHVLLDGPRAPALRDAYAAARATRDLAAAFHHAAGRPTDELWGEAIASTRRFLDMCDELMAPASPQLSELRSFVAENADALPPRFELKLAS
jgi:hypothetical protein